MKYQTLSWCDRCDQWHGYTIYQNNTIEANCPCVAEQINAKMAGHTYNFSASKNRPWRIISDEQNEPKQEEKIEGSSGVCSSFESSIGDGSGNSHNQSQGYDSGNNSSGSETP
jgi:hypothetical protein